MNSTHTPRPKSGHNTPIHPSGGEADWCP
jgi:hypothetical protein